MPGTTTVLLTTFDPVLVDALKQRCPDIIAARLNPQERTALPPGNVLCFIDWLLPDRSGLELVRQLNESRINRDAWIALVLESDDLDDRRRALKAGADDYLVGPLDADILAERVRRRPAEPTSIGNDRHAAPAPRKRLELGDLSLDMVAHQVRYRGTPIPLRVNEFRVLAHFIEHADEVVGRRDLMESLGKAELLTDERTVDVWIGRVRRALAAHGAPDPFRTVRSLGYVMDSPTY